MPDPDLRARTRASKTDDTTAAYEPVGGPMTTSKGPTAHTVGGPMTTSKGPTVHEQQQHTTAHCAGAGGAPRHTTATATSAGALTCRRQSRAAEDNVSYLLKVHSSPTRPMDRSSVGYSRVSSTHRGRGSNSHGGDARDEGQSSGRPRQHLRLTEMLRKPEPALESFKDPSLCYLASPGV